MEAINESELWRQIPPEEKFELMSRAHANGLFGALITIAISSTVAIGLQIPAIFWGALVISPLVFQFSAGKAWRGLRPKIMLEYLAARSASRRYAFMSKARDLELNFIFKGKLEQQFESDAIQEALEAMITQTKEAEVWVALFTDTVVMISEKYGGATLQLGALLNENLEVTTVNGEDGEYSSGKEILLSVREKPSKAPKKYRLTSRYPAALIVFEKKLRSLHEDQLNRVSQLLEFQKQSTGKVEKKTEVGFGAPDDD